MAAFSPFQPQSKSTLVDNTAAQQIQATGTATSAIQYRIRNRTSAEAWLSWQPPQPGGGQPTMNTTVPTVGSPQANIIGMLALSCETFTFPPNTWFQASAGATFEIDAGEGL